MGKRKLTGFLFMLTIIFNLFAALVSGCDKKKAFVPVLRFSVASDVHIEDGNGSILEEERLAKLFDKAYSYSASKKSKYNKVDAAFFIGDFTDRGTTESMQKFKRIVDENIKSETRLVVSLGNHEFYYEQSMAEERFKDVFSSEVDEHIVISGFHFIKLSPNGNYFEKEKLEWLRKELEIASKDTPNLPIFVMQHQHVKGTVYGSSSWGADGLYEVLSKFPQVVDFSGHSHYPINDERSLWQGDFTALGTGTLSYVEMGLNGVFGNRIFPHGKNGDYKYKDKSGEKDYAVFQLVEVDKNGNIRIIGYDLIGDVELFTKYIFTPTNKASFKTIEDRIKETQIPEFKKEAVATLEVENGIVSVIVPQAESKSSIESYKAEVYEEENFAGNYYALSGYIYNPRPNFIKIKLGKFEDNKKYTIKIYAVNAYGAASCEPLILKVDN